MFRKYILPLILVLSFPLLLFASDPIEITVSGGQTATGVSASICTMDGYEVASIQLVTTGTSHTIDIECTATGAGSAPTNYTVISGTGLPDTTVGNTIHGLASYAFKWCRVNVTACTACNVKAFCNYWKSGR